MRHSHLHLARVALLNDHGWTCLPSDEGAVEHAVTRLLDTLPDDEAQRAAYDLNTARLLDVVTQ